MTRQTDATLDALDRKILTIIQSGFPVEPRPYKVIGDAVGLTESRSSLSHGRAD